MTRCGVYVLHGRRSCQTPSQRAREILRASVQLTAQRGIRYAHARRGRAIVRCGCGWCEIFGRQCDRCSKRICGPMNNGFVRPVSPLVFFSPTRNLSGRTALARQCAGAVPSSNDYTKRGLTVCESRARGGVRASSRNGRCVCKQSGSREAAMACTADQQRRPARATRQAGGGRSLRRRDRSNSYSVLGNARSGRSCIPGASRAPTQTTSTARGGHDHRPLSVHLPASRRATSLFQQQGSA